MMERHKYGYADESWQVVVPWPMIATTVLVIPILAVLGAMVVTRARLPLVSRVDP